MKIARIQINHKNVITRVGQPFSCDDEKVIENLENMNAFEKPKKTTKVKAKKTVVIAEEAPTDIKEDGND